MIDRTTETEKKLIEASEFAKRWKQEASIWRDVAERWEMKYAQKHAEAEVLLSWLNAARLELEKKS